MPDAAGNFKGIALGVSAAQWARIFGSAPMSHPSSAKDKDTHEHTGRKADHS